MFRLTEVDPPADQVRRITFVPFLADGRCRRDPVYPGR
jgi:hypothetical protein